MNEKMKLIVGIMLGVLVAVIAILVGIVAGMKISSFVSINNELLNFALIGYIYYVSISLSLKLFNVSLKLIKYKMFENERHIL